MKSFRVMVLIAALAFSVSAADQWKIFSGQVNGPVKNPGGTDLKAFALKRFPGLFWAEGYYHHLNFPDGSMITVSIGFNKSDVNLAFVYARPGRKPFHDFIITDVDDAKFDPKGFGLAIGKNRVRLDGNHYYLDLELEKVKARLAYEIASPSYTYGDGMVRYPDGKSFAYYSLPIPWAKVHARAEFDGKVAELDGSGNMNHDAAVIFPAYMPSNQQTFWFFGPDHALAVTDFYTHPEFGRVPVQRLVFVSKEGGMFTSTNFPLKWDDWVLAKGIPFRYPRHYTLSAEGQGAKLQVEVHMQEALLLEDLYSNLPAALRLVAERLTRNGWTFESWSTYTITYSSQGQTRTYQGRGITRWMDLEEDRK